jgi:hypothetical protein
VGVGVGVGVHVGVVIWGLGGLRGVGLMSGLERMSS